MKAGDCGEHTHPFMRGHSFRSTASQDRPRGQHPCNSRGDKRTKQQSKEESSGFKSKTASPRRLVHTTVLGHDATGTCTDRHTCTELLRAHTRHNSSILGATAAYAAVLHASSACTCPPDTHLHMCAVRRVQPGRHPCPICTKVYCEAASHEAYNEAKPYVFARARVFASIHGEVVPTTRLGLCVRGENKALQLHAHRRHVKHRS